MRNFLRWLLIGRRVVTMPSGVRLDCDSLNRVIRVLEDDEPRFLRGIVK